MLNEKSTASTVGDAVLPLATKKVGLSHCRRRLFDCGGGLAPHAGRRRFLRPGGNRRLARCPRDVDPLARSLAAIATEVEDSPSGQVNPTLFAQVPELRFVYHNRKECPDAKWRSVQCYSVPSLSLGRLRDLISDKTKKLSAYQPCDVYWLLLVVDFMDSAQDQGLHWPPGEALSSSPFERVLLYKPQFAEVLQVPQ